MPPLVAETVSDSKVSYRGLRGWLDEVSRMGDPVPPMFWLRDPEGNVLMIAEA